MKESSKKGESESILALKSCSGRREVSASGRSQNHLLFEIVSTDNASAQ
jgi:hypothetical protein